MKRILAISVLIFCLCSAAMAETQAFVRLDGIWLEAGEYSVISDADGCRLQWRGRNADFEHGEGVLIFDILSYDIMKVRLTRIDSACVPPVLETEALNWYGDLFGYMESYEPKLREFSYAEYIADWPDGTPGVKTEGFKNTDISPVYDMETAVIRAAQECSVSYDISAVYYDADSDMWNVFFMTYMQSGGYQNVYMDSDGITHRVVFGE